MPGPLEPHPVALYPSPPLLPALLVPRRQALPPHMLTALSKAHLPRPEVGNVHVKETSSTFMPFSLT